MHFLDKLDSITKSHNSLVCVGLDSDLDKIPKHLHSESNPVLAFNKAIIEATVEYAQSYKLNLAFYETLGSHAHETLKSTLAAIPPEIVTIGDAKRGDIGNTAAMYAQALFEEYDFDAATIAPYMGFDSVEPFLRFEDKGVFILALTSNVGAKDFQYLQVNGQPLYKQVVNKVVEWNTYGNAGLVVGATHPEELQGIREMAGELPILIPGLGAQGGNAELSVKYGVAANGGRALFNSSRGIIYQGDDVGFAEAAGSAASTFRDLLNSYRC